MQAKWSATKGTVMAGSSLKVGSVWGAVKCGNRVLMVCMGHWAHLGGRHGRFEDPCYLRHEQENESIFLESENMGGGGAR